MYTSVTAIRSRIWKHKYFVRCVFSSGLFSQKKAADISPLPTMKPLPGKELSRGRRRVIRRYFRGIGILKPSLCVLLSYQIPVSIGKYFLNIPLIGYEFFLFLLSRMHNSSNFSIEKPAARYYTVTISPICIPRHNYLHKSNCRRREKICWYPHRLKFWPTDLVMHRQSASWQMQDMMPLTFHCSVCMSIRIIL